jgi:hypothetical protein
MAASAIGFGIRPPPPTTFTSGMARQQHHHRQCKMAPILAISTVVRRPRTLLFVGGTDDFEFEPDDAALAELEEVVEEEEEEEDDDDSDGLVGEDRELDVGMDDEDDIVVEDLGENEIAAKFERVLEEGEEDEDEEEYYEEEYEEGEDDGEEDYGTVQDWDEDEGGDFELQEDDDPNYTKQKQLMEANAARRVEREDEERFDPLDYIMNTMPDKERAQFEALPLKAQVDDRMRGMEMTEDDISDIDSWDQMEELMNTTSSLEEDPWLMEDIDDGKPLERAVGMTNQDMKDLQDSWESIQAYKGMEDPNRVNAMGMMGVEYSNETLTEVYNVLREIGHQAYNCTRFLLYDLDFNVTNLVLAAMKHNPNAPILFQHWYPQLLVMERYADVSLDWTWDDVQAADMSELQRYYNGMGYAEIPSKQPAETGIISLEDLDEEEIKMAAFERWMTDVYNSEWDRKDFDDEDLRDEDNVFSKYFEMPLHPDMPSFADAQADVREFNDTLYEELSYQDGDEDDLSDDEKEYRDFMGQEIKYEHVDDPEFQELFRGHVVVACTGDDSDLEIAEKITLAMEKNFGKQIFVETRMIAHAREEDNVFEVWIESYDVELLHSKKRATTGSKGWTGPAECDDAQVDYLVEQVGFLISDAARKSYKFEYGMEGV